MGGPQRKLWLDWQRGLAVLFMVEWHTYDAWRLEAVAQGRLHDWLNLVGGFAAPSFLYMAGVSQTLADGARERRGVPAMERRRDARGRALWLLGVAYLFRLSLWVVDGGWASGGDVGGVARAFALDVLKVDVLNVIAVALFVSAVAVVGRGAAGVLAALALAASFAFLAPVVAGHAPADSPLAEYLWNSRASFALFPWAAFLFAGAAVGRVSRDRDRPALLLLAGAGLWLLGLLADRAPPVYAYQDFWRASPAWFLMRLGIVVGMTGVLMGLPAAADGALSWLRTLGRHSLFGYVVSVLLPYGSVSHLLHHRLSARAALGAVAAMIVFIWASSSLLDRFQARRAIRPPAAPPVPPGR